ncbi:helix-turn-helix domain-containing protein [Streptococcus pneumoniae]|nr:helix-turn-helix domain-containing protein [Streptococcus pneumoniae]
MSDLLFENPQNRLETLMQENKYTLRKVSEDTNIPITTLSGYKKNLRTPKKNNAKILADYFGVSVPYLLGHEKEPNLIKAEPIIPLELVQELSSINDKKKKILQEYLELGKREQVILKQIREDL